MDSGFPLTKQPNILSDIIATPNIVSRMFKRCDWGFFKCEQYSSTCHCNSCSMAWKWPKTSKQWSFLCHYQQGWIYFEVWSFWWGASEFPTLWCTKFNSNPSIINDVKFHPFNSNPAIINDVRFHLCVRSQPWETHQVLLLVPLNGDLRDYVRISFKSIHKKWACHFLVILSKVRKDTFSKFYPCCWSLQGSIYRECYTQ